MDETGAVQNLLMETFSLNQSGNMRVVSLFLGHVMSCDMYAMLRLICCQESSFDCTEGDITLFDTNGRPSSPQSLLLQNPVEESKSFVCVCMCMHVLFSSGS